MYKMRFITNVLIVIILILSLTYAIPLNITENQNETNVDQEEPKDLYIIKTVIVEIGLLTNGTDDNSTKTQETEEFSFYSPNNKTLLNIPLKIDNFNETTTEINQNLTTTTKNVEKRSNLDEITTKTSENSTKTDENSTKLPKIEEKHLNLENLTTVEDKKIITNTEVTINKEDNTTLVN